MLRTIEYAICADGSMPAKEFVEGLDESEQRKLDTLFRRLAAMGKIFNKEQLTIRIFLKHYWKYVNVALLVKLPMLCST